MIPQTGKNPCTANPNRGMYIMAACMHDAVIAGTVRHIAFLLQGESVHIKPYSQNLTLSVLAFKKPHNAGLAHTRLNLDPEIPEIFRNNSGGTKLLKTRLRMSMDVPSYYYKIIEECSGLFLYGQE